SLHPLRVISLGWFRHNKVSPARTIHITEQQSDIRPHGFSWTYYWNQFKNGNPKRGGDAPQMMGYFKQKFDDKSFPHDKLNKVIQILFGDKTDPADVMIDAFHQYHRDKGMADVKIYAPSSDWRGKLSYYGTRDPPVERTLAELGERHGTGPEVDKALQGKLVNDREAWITEVRGGGWHKVHDVDLSNNTIKVGIDHRVVPIAPDRKILSRRAFNLPLHLPDVYDKKFEEAGYDMRAAKYGDEPSQQGTSHRGAIDDLFHVSPVRKYEDDLEKAIRDLPDQPLVKQGPYDNHYDVSAYLTPEHRAAGYTARIRSHHNPHPWMTAEVFHQNVPVGGVAALVGPERFSNGRIVKDMAFDFSDVKPEHQNKGLGMALYESLLAHGLNVFGVTHVRGSEHSSMAHEVHKKVAAKHGLGYLGVAMINPHGRYPTEQAWRQAASRAADFKYKPYRYSIEGA
ncbi:MAG: GNAT family N-acetyltransferase, partial [Spirochaetota bacterium]